MIDEKARVKNSEVEEVEVREYSTIHDSNIGPDSRIYERVSIKKSEIGEKVDINTGTYIENAKIGDKVQIGPNCSIVGVTHELSEKGMKHREDIFPTIKIETGAFIGAGATVLPGLKIGKNSVVAANSTVTEDVPENHIWTGSPPDHRLEKLEEWTD